MQTCIMLSDLYRTRFAARTCSEHDLWCSGSESSHSMTVFGLRGSIQYVLLTLKATCHRTSPVQRHWLSKEEASHIMPDLLTFCNS